MKIALVFWNDNEVTTYVAESEQEVKEVYNPLMQYIKEIKFVNIPK